MFLNLAIYKSYSSSFKITYLQISGYILGAYRFRISRLFFDFSGHMLCHDTAEL